MFEVVEGDELHICVMGQIPPCAPYSCIWFLIRFSGSAPLVDRAPIYQRVTRILLACMCIVIRIHIPPTKMIDQTLPSLLIRRIVAEATQALLQQLLRL